MNSRRVARTIYALWPSIMTEPLGDLFTISYLRDCGFLGGAALAAADVSLNANSTVISSLVVGSPVVGSHTADFPLDRSPIADSFFT